MGVVCGRVRQNLSSLYQSRRAPHKGALQKDMPDFNIDSGQFDQVGKFKFVILSGPGAIGYAEIVLLIGSKLKIVVVFER